MSASQPTVETTYKADNGTVTWKPGTDTGTLTFNNATISVTGEGDNAQPSPAA